jgi:predicted unusual protein kinase regulating ubiquinone biosynthesis (AarF/ABC1/UbiB family)
MNVISDFSLRVKKAAENTEKQTPNVDDLLRLLDEKDNLLAQYQAQLTKIGNKEPSPKKAKSGSKKPSSDSRNEKKKVTSQV